MIIGDIKIIKSIDVNLKYHPNHNTHTLMCNESIKSKFIHYTKNGYNAIHSLYVPYSSNITNFKKCIHRIDNLIVEINEKFKTFEGFPVSLNKCEIYINNNKNLLLATLPQFDKYPDYFNIKIFEYSDVSKAYNNINFNNQLYIYNQIFERFDNILRTKWEITQLINRYKNDTEKLISILNLFLDCGYAKYIPLRIFKKIEDWGNVDLYRKLYSKHPKIKKNKKGLYYISKITNGDYLGTF